MYAHARERVCERVSVSATPRACVRACVCVPAIEVHNHVPLLPVLPTLMPVLPAAAAADAAAVEGVDSRVRVLVVLCCLGGEAGRRSAEAERRDDDSQERAEDRHRRHRLRKNRCAVWANTARSNLRCNEYVMTGSGLDWGRFYDYEDMLHRIYLLYARLCVRACVTACHGVRASARARESARSGLL